MRNLREELEEELEEHEELEEELEEHEELEGGT